MKGKKRLRRDSSASGKKSKNSTGFKPNFSFNLSTHKQTRSGLLRSYLLGRHEEFSTQSIWLGSRLRTENDCPEVPGRLALVFGSVEVVHFPGHLGTVIHDTLVVLLEHVVRRFEGVHAGQVLLLFLDPVPELGVLDFHVLVQ